VPGLTDLERRCVLPFYLRMMGLNALSHVVPFDTLRDVARETTDDEVTRLLASEWRPRVMGAWLACGRARRLDAALLESLETSWGTLTAPPLAIVALHGLGAKAVPALEAYLRRDVEHQLGSAAFTAAVLERLGSVPADVAVNDQDRRAVDGMLTVARRLSGAEPQSPVDVG
jgi:hypothetical protein